MALDACEECMNEFEEDDMIQCPTCATLYCSDCWKDVVKLEGCLECGEVPK